MMWAEYVTRMAKMRNVYRIFDEEPQERRLWSPRRRCKDIIKVCLKETEHDGVDWIHLFEVRDNWTARLYTAMNLQTLKKEGNFFASYAAFSFSRRNLLHRWFLICEDKRIGVI